MPLLVIGLCVATSPGAAPAPAAVGLARAADRRSRQRRHGDALRRSQPVDPGAGEDGANAPVIEMGYNFAFASHPELAGPGAITKQEARSLGDLCLTKRNPPDSMPRLPGASTLGERHAAAAGQAPRSRRDAREIPDQPGDLLPSWCRSTRTSIASSSR